jgi:hypothetical protein
MASDIGLSHRDMIGSNLPPRDEEIRGNLAEKHSEIAARAQALIDAAGRVLEIEDEETSKKVADFIRKQIDPCLKAIDGARVAEKEPYLSGGRTVDGYFQTLATPLDKAKAIVNGKQLVYRRKVEAEERRRREEVEAAARAEAKRLADAAAVAEKAVRDAKGLSDAIAAEALAKQAAADAEAAAKSAAAKPAEMSRVRGDYGGVQSLRSFWTFKNLDRNKIDLQKLRAYLALEDIEKAVRAFVKAGGRDLAGCEIFEDTKL